MNGLRFRGRRSSAFHFNGLPIEHEVADLELGPRFHAPAPGEGTKPSLQDPERLRLQPPAEQAHVPRWAVSFPEGFAISYQGTWLGARGRRTDRCMTRQGSDRAAGRLLRASWPCFGK